VYSTNRIVRCEVRLNILSLANPDGWCCIKAFHICGKSTLKPNPRLYIRQTSGSHIDFSARGVERVLAQQLLSNMNMISTSVKPYLDILRNGHSGRGLGWDIPYSRGKHNRPVDPKPVHTYRSHEWRSKWT